MKRPMKPSTRVNHPPTVKVPEDNRPLVAPIYQFILAEVDIKDAGSASGVINAMGQIGGDIDHLKRGR